ncbi:MAG: pseudouridine synthase [Verrucomicrobiales bacterium]|nr:pseudouridine synthase [Verrucomicrobiales bacterium]
MSLLSQLAGCHFAPLTDLGPRRAKLLSLCKEWRIRGHLSLTPEGIEFCLAGAQEPLQCLLKELKSWTCLQDLEFSISNTSHQPFDRIRVTIQRELGSPDVLTTSVVQRRGLSIPPHAFKGWLDRRRNMVLLDLRDDHDALANAFERAQSIRVSSHRELPAALRRLQPELKEQLIVLVCQNGSRSEQAAHLLQHQGFRRVFRLKGGLRGYREACENAPLLDQTKAPQAASNEGGRVDPPDPCTCFACDTLLSEEALRDPRYVPGKFCPHCFLTEAQEMAANIGTRLARIRTASNPLPGSFPRDCFKAITIRPSCDGRTVLDALRFAVSHLPDSHWERECLEGRILNSHHEPVSARHPVRAGQTYLHRFPDTIEPDVNPDVDILHEDAALIVINKPAPLPMHAGGRFFRNTLQHLLNAAYHPEQPRPAHRLDANTTGVLLITRNQLYAGRLQPQFSQGRVRKQYIVRVHGHPPEDVFDCAAAVSSESRELGSRGIALTGGLPARTEFRVLRRDPDATTLLEASPLTGRTNQIRVHLWHLGFPVCGDPVYLPKGGLGHTQTLDTQAPPLNLHSWRIQFGHPLHGRPAEFTAPVPTWAGFLPLAG